MIAKLANWSERDHQGTRTAGGRKSSGRRGPALLLGTAAPRPGSLPNQEQALALGRLLEPQDHWRLFADLGPGACFLDIETTGLSEEDVITVVGISHAGATQLLVRGKTLTRKHLEQALRPARLLVTFNGSGFDLPRLRRAFPGLAAWNLPHFDLAVGGRLIGLRGGLKSVERQLGYARGASLGVNGAEAAWLWRAHEAGDPDALPRLLHYCREDVQSLGAIAPRIYRRLVRRSALPETGWIRGQVEVDAAESSESARLPLPSRLVRTPRGMSAQLPRVDDSSNRIKVGSILQKISAVARASLKAYAAIAGYSRRS